MDPATETAIREFKAALEHLYGERLGGVVLFGSHARGTAGPESDVDLLVRLEGPVEPGCELDRMADVAYDIGLKHDVLFTLVPVDEDEYRTLQSPLLINVRREGVPA